MSAYTDIAPVYTIGTWLVVDILLDMPPTPFNLGVPSAFMSIGNVKSTPFLSTCLVKHVPGYWLLVWESPLQLLLKDRAAPSVNHQGLRGAACCPLHLYEA